jgi:hypothetical protein
MAAAMSNAFACVSDAHKADVLLLAVASRAASR